MKLLVLDTTNSSAFAALQSGNELDSALLARAHSENLMNEMNALLTKHCLTIQDLDCIGVVTGPGSFTGIRIGLAVVKGIKFALNTATVAVNSFETIAYNIPNGRGIVVLDSGNNEPYFAEFLNYEMISVGADGFEQIKQMAEEKKLHVYYRNFEHSFDLLGFIPVEVSPKSVTELMEKRFNEGKACDINALTPLYVKLSQAEKTLTDDVVKRMTVTPAKDAKELHLLDKTSFSENIWSEEEYQKELALPDRKYFVAKLNGNPIAYYGVEDFDDEINLLKLAVLPEFRKHGVGAALTGHMVKSFQAGPAKQIFLEVRKSNISAIKLYEKYGFKGFYERPRYYPNGESCIVMFLVKGGNETKV